MNNSFGVDSEVSRSVPAPIDRAVISRMLCSTGRVHALPLHFESAQQGPLSQASLNLERYSVELSDLSIPN